MKWFRKKYEEKEKERPAFTSRDKEKLDLVYGVLFDIGMVNVNPWFFSFATQKNESRIAALYDVIDERCAKMEKIEQQVENYRQSLISPKGKK